MLAFTAAPAEALPLPLVAIEFVAAFSAVFLTHADDWPPEEEQEASRSDAESLSLGKTPDNAMLLAP